MFCESCARRGVGGELASYCAQQQASKPIGCRDAAAKRLKGDLFSEVPRR
jgi:hypothetical protein